MIKNNFFTFSKHQFTRIKRNFFSLFVNFSSKLLTQLLFPPLMLLIWGVENFGIWVFVTALPSTFTFLNLHFSYATRIEMTINNAKKKYKLLNSTFQNGLGLVIVNMAIYTILWMSCFFFVEIDLKIFESISDEEIKIILMLILVSFYFNIFDSILTTGTSYWGKIYIPAYIKTILDVFLKVLIILSGFFFNSLIYPAIILFLISIIRTLILFYYFLLNKKSIELSLKLINLKTSLRLFRLSLSFYAETIIQIIKHNGLTIILGIFYSAEIIGLITTSKTLFYFLPIIFIDMFNQVGIYEYSEALGRKAKKFIRQNYVKHILLVFFFLVAFIIISLTIGGEIYDIWTGYVYDLDITLLILIVFNSAIFLLQSTVGSVLKSANNFLKPVVCEALISVLAIITSFYCLSIGYNYIDIFKVFLIASLISMIVYSYYSLIFFNKIK